MQGVDVPIVALPTFAGDTANFVAVAGNAGCDLYATADVKLLPGDRKLIGTGMSFAIPEGVEAQVRPRSGLALRCGLTIVNSPGTIDPSYRGEIAVIALNTEPVILPSHFSALLEFIRSENEEGVEQLLDEYLTSLATRTIHIARGERFAQLVFAQYVIPQFVWHDTLETTIRGAQGFGSSGM